MSQKLFGNIGLTWEELYSHAFGKPLEKGINYQNNVRVGRFSRRQAARIFAWIRENYPDEAQLIEEEISAHAGTKKQKNNCWEKFIQEHSEFYGLEIGSPSVQMHAILTRHTRQPQQVQQQMQQLLPGEDKKPTFPINVPFNLHLYSPIEGYVIGLQHVRNRWLKIPLGPDNLGASISKDSALTFPTAPPGKDSSAFQQPRLTEDEQGRHRIVFLIIPAQLGQQTAQRLAMVSVVPPDLLEQLVPDIIELPHESWRVKRLDVLFVL